MDESTPISGLTAEEQAVMDALIAAWQGFVVLAQTERDRPDFCRAIHECQRILATRVVAREYPDYWVI